MAEVVAAKRLNQAGAGNDSILLNLECRPSYIGTESCVRRPFFVQAATRSVSWQIALPLPERIAEAYFVAIWSRYETHTLDDQAVTSSQANQPLIDYFTLERPAKPTPEWQTCFCNWSPEGAHRNGGVGPALCYEEFVNFLSGFTLREPDDDFPPIPIEE